MEAIFGYDERVAFETQIGTFKGPLDLLLDLIEKRKFHINDVSLAKVADDYIAHTRALATLPIGETAHFLLVASTLVFIKSKSLLPDLTLSAEEESDVEMLKRRLMILDRMRKVGDRLADTFGEQIMFARIPAKHSTLVFAPDRETTRHGLLAAVRRVLSALPKPEKLPEAIVKKVVSLEEMMEKLAERMKTSMKMSFRSFAGRAERAEMVVSFLALLELVRQGLMDVAQSETFGDISMESRDVGVPRYH